MHLSFDYAAKSAAPLRTKMLLAERSEDALCPNAVEARHIKQKSYYKTAVKSANTNELYHDMKSPTIKQKLVTFII